MKMLVFIELVDAQKLWLAGSRSWFCCLSNKLVPYILVVVSQTPGSRMLVVLLLTKHKTRGETQLRCTQQSWIPVGAER